MTFLLTVASAAECASMAIPRHGAGAGVTLALGAGGNAAAAPCAAAQYG
jgi:hypothetical protein